MIVSDVISPGDSVIKVDWGQGINVPIFSGAWGTNAPSIGYLAQDKKECILILAVTGLLSVGAKEQREALVFIASTHRRIVGWIPLGVAGTPTVRRVR